MWLYIEQLGERRFTSIAEENTDFIFLLSN